MIGGDRHRCSPLVPHRSVVVVPILVGAAGCGEDRPKQKSQPIVVDAGMWIVRADQLRRSLDGDPSPTRTNQRMDGGVDPPSVVIEAADQLS